MLRLRSDGMTWQTVDDEIVILDLEGSSYFKVNGSGTVLWNRLQQRCSEADLHAALIERFGIDAAMAAEDVAAFLSELKAHDLVEEVEG